MDKESILKHAAVTAAVVIMIAIALVVSVLAGGGDAYTETAPDSRPASTTGNINDATQHSPSDSHAPDDTHAPSDNGGDTQSAGTDAEGDTDTVFIGGTAQDTAPDTFDAPEALPPLDIYDTLQ